MPRTVPEICSVTLKALHVDDAHDSLPIADLSANETMPKTT